MWKGNIRETTFFSVKQPVCHWATTTTLSITERKKEMPKKRRNDERNENRKIKCTSCYQPYQQHSIWTHNLCRSFFSFSEEKKPMISSPLPVDVGSWQLKFNVHESKLYQFRLIWMQHPAFYQKFTYTKQRERGRHTHAERATLKKKSPSHYGLEKTSRCRRHYHSKRSSVWIDWPHWFTYKCDETNSTITEWFTNIIIVFGYLYVYMHTYTQREMETTAVCVCAYETSWKLCLETTNCNPSAFKVYYVYHWKQYDQLLLGSPIWCVVFVFSGGNTVNFVRIWIDYQPTDRPSDRKTKKKYAQIGLFHACMCEYGYGYGEANHNVWPITNNAVCVWVLIAFNRKGKRKLPNIYEYVSLETVKPSRI